MALAGGAHDALAEKRAELDAGAIRGRFYSRANGGPGQTVTHSVTTHSEAMSLLWVYLEALSPTCGLDA